MSIAGARAVLFDLDGTLVDSAPDIATATDCMLEALGLEPVGQVAVGRWIGNGARRLVKRALTGEWDGEPEPALFEQAQAYFFRYYREHLVERTELYPGAREALDSLRAGGVPVALVTNKPASLTTPLLEALELADYFATVLGGDSLSVKKPDPKPLYEAAEACGVAAESAIMVGDSMTDLRAARAAGMPMVCVSYGYHQDGDVFDAGPDAVVDNLAQIPLMIDGGNALR